MGEYYLIYPTRDLYMYSAFFNFNYPQTQQIPKLEITGESGNAVELICISDIGARLLTYVENITDPFSIDLTCDEILDGASYRILLRIYTKDQQGRYTILKDQAIYTYYPHNVIRYPTGHISIKTFLEKEKWDGIAGEALIYDLDSQTFFRIPVEFSFQEPLPEPFIRKNRKHLIIYIGKYDAYYFYHPIEPPLIKIIYYDGSRAHTVLDTTQTWMAIINFRFNFTTVDDMRKFIRILLSDQAETRKILTNPRLSEDEKYYILKQLILFKEIEVYGSRLMFTNIDFSKREINVTFKLYFGSADWITIGLGLALLIGGVLLCITGVGAKIGIPMIAKAMSFLGMGIIAFGVISYTAERVMGIIKGQPVNLPWTEWLIRVDTAFQEAIMDIDKQFFDYYETLLKLHKENKLDTETYEYLYLKATELHYYVKSRIETLRKETVSVIREIKEVVEKEVTKPVTNWLYVIGAGLGGLAVGYVLGKARG